MKKNLVVLSGAGLDKESGLDTFRNSNGTDGLWNNHKIEDICTIEAVENNLDVVNQFYNQYRQDVLKAQPNQAHIDLSTFEKNNEDKFDVYHITTNVSDLLERAGCTDVLHLHGNILKSRSSLNRHNHMFRDEDVIGGVLEQITDILPGENKRPHVVMFGENVPYIDQAYALMQAADYIIVVGTSLCVFPANGLIRSGIKSVYVDPGAYSMETDAILKELDVKFDLLVNLPASIGINKALQWIS